MGQIERKLTKRVIQVLRDSGYPLVARSGNDFAFAEIQGLYEKKGYEVDAEFGEFLRIFADKRLNFTVDEEADFLDFSVRNVLKSYPRKIVLTYERELALEGLTPFGYAYSKEIGLFRDKRNWVYGLDDDIVTLHGRNLWEAVDGIMNGRIPERISGG